MGSVKDLRVIKQAEGNKSGVGHFYFSDRYSVFDWGEMPDLIKDKGKALCILGAFFFEKLESLGIKTHYQGIVQDDQVKHLADLHEPGDIMQVTLVNVIKPRMSGNIYDYSIYNSQARNFLIPLEVIYRNALPEGSSVFRRLKNGSLTLQELGFKEMPDPDDVLSESILDVSTKLEVTDRYLSWNEAQKISALNDEELFKLKETTLAINKMISASVEKVGLKNEDGKVEYAFDQNRNLMLADVLGTPDECRFTFSGIPVSKEVARIYYRSTPWFTAIEQAKKKDRANWKKIITIPPPSLPTRLYELISQLYQSVCNEVTQREWFSTPQLKTILYEIKEYMKL
jgi:phosphoribosylaminoimidazole-succinocarboxamide synthase